MRKTIATFEDFRFRPLVGKSLIKAHNRKGAAMRQGNLEKWLAYKHLIWVLERS